MGEWDIKDKTILVTGSTDGIGKQTALELLKRGAKVLIHGKDLKKLEKTKKEFSKYGEVKYYKADFSSFKDIKRMADEILENESELKVLINNAGIFSHKRILSEDGYELTFAVNHLAPFYLTYLLLPLLKKSSPSRIINVSSMAHSSSIDFSNLQGERGYSGYEAYSLSKLANILFTFELAEKLKDYDITVNCLHPGVINTKLLREGWGFGGGSVVEGAKTSVYLASSSEVSNITGKYFSNQRVSEPASIAYDKEIRKKLWEISEKLTGIEFKI